MVEYHLAQTFTSQSGHRRITYRPDLSKETPWVAYYLGTESLCFPDITDARLYHYTFGDPLILKETICK